MKVARKILFYFLLTVLAALAIFSGSVFLFKDRLLQQFIREANKSINTPVKIGHIDVSSWSHFPDLTITFTDVYVEDSDPGIYPLLEAKKISFAINAWDAYQGRYSIRQLQIFDSETHLKVDEKGHSNFVILKKTEDHTEPIVFDLRKVKLTNTHVQYRDQQTRQQHHYESRELTTSIHLEGNHYTIETEGDVTVKKLSIQSWSLLTDKSFDVQTTVLYDANEKSVVINDSELKLSKAAFQLKGNYSWKNKPVIDASLSASNTNIQTILSLLPNKLTHGLTEYQSEGDLYFTLKVNGDVNNPRLVADFGCRNASFFHPRFKSRIEQANLRGSFASSSITDAGKAELFIKDLTGKLNGREFSADFSVQQFDDPVVTLQFNGSLDGASIENFYPIDGVSEVQGLVKANIALAGKVSLLKNKATAQEVQASGSIELDDVAFAVERKKIKFSEIHGALQFNKNDIAMSNLSGRLDQNDFVLNGFLKNVIPFLLFEHQPIGIEADLHSTFLDLDQLIALSVSGTAKGDDGFSISPLLHLNFNCDVARMKYKRFAPHRVKGDLLVQHQVAVTRHVSLEAMGGKLELSGIVDARQPKAIDVSTSFKLDGIRVDSVFYVFENFYQNFIEDKHLQGRAFADVSLEMSLDPKLKLFPETLIADIDVLIKDGKLNHFEPLQKLNKYLDDEALDQLRFADLKNTIHIEKKTIFIPQMDISSNATSIRLSGKHTFDQQIDYRVVAPLRNKKKIDPDEAFGAIEETGGQSKIFLKIIGTTDKYDVKLDREATKKKIVSDLKKEVRELKEAFQSRGKQKMKEAELKKDEYFDWDN